MKRKIITRLFVCCFLYGIAQMLPSCEKCPSGTEPLVGKSFQVESIWIMEADSVSGDMEKVNVPKIFASFPVTDFTLSFRKDTAEFWHVYGFEVFYFFWGDMEGGRIHLVSESPITTSCCGPLGPRISGECQWISGSQGECFLIGERAGMLLREIP